MLRDPTLFIVGAGASHEFGLPLGTELAENIAHKLHFKFQIFDSLEEGDYEFYMALKRRFFEGETVNSHLRACSRIKTGIRLARSIDNYIDAHKEDLEVALMGKLAIVDCIAKAEKSSELYFAPFSSNSGFDIDKLGKTWIAELVDILFHGKSKSTIDDVFNNLSIISFNYDRCIQQSLVLALHTMYHFDFSKCHELVDKIQIIYPYGSLGPLVATQVGSGLDFGVDIDPSYLFQLSKNIRTYSEQVADNVLAERISVEVTKAKNIVFLGCAYHPQNIKMLKSNSEGADKNIFGTAIGISESGVRQKKLDILQSIYYAESPAFSQPFHKQFEAQQNVHLHNNLTCYELMKEYRHSF